MRTVSNAPTLPLTSPEILFCTRVSSYRTGAVEYAMAKASVQNDTIHLVFHVSTEPFTEMLPYILDFSPLEIDQKASKYCFQVERINQNGDDFNKVTRVLVDVLLIKPPSSVNLALAGIGELCQSNFPNMNFEQSTLHVHHDQNHWRYNDLLSPLQTFSDPNNPVRQSLHMYPLNE